MFTLENGVSVSAFLVAVIMRLVPHPPNTTAVGALGLYFGSKTHPLLATAVLFSTLVLSDIGLHFIFNYSIFGYWSFFTYGAFLVNVAIGHFALKNKTLDSPKETARLVGCSALSTLSFFLITHIGVMISVPNEVYPNSVSGYLSALTLGLPFVGYTGLGDIVYSLAFFGAHTYVTRKASPPTISQNERQPILPIASQYGSVVV